MHKAQKEMRKVLPAMDVVIEILDARIPFSSRNPLLASIRGHKPHVQILSKADLADPAKTQTWVDFLQDDSRRVIPLNSKDRKDVLRIPDICLKLIKEFGSTHSTTQVSAMITGIPNVGKSTLINSMAGRAIAKTGNEPAITKGQQKIRLRPDFELCDTPGVLWPNLGHHNIGYRLATLGSIRETAIDYADVGCFAVATLLELYPERLLELYPDFAAEAIESLGSEVPAQIPPEVMFLESFAVARGAIKKGAQADLDHASRLFLTDLRRGAFGRITLELPEDEIREMKELEAKAQAREEKR